MEPTAEDYPPSLEWEYPVWRLYVMCANQWRMGPQGPIGLDYAVLIPQVERKGWDQDVAMTLFACIETAFLTKEVPGNGSEDPDTD